MKSTFIAIFMLLCAMSTVQASELELMEACRLYNKAMGTEDTQSKKALFSQAADTFQNYQVQQKEALPYIDYNLGTIHLSLNQYGKAILHLKRAYVFLNNDPRVVANLMKAGKMASVEVFPKRENNIMQLLIQYWSSLSAKIFQGLALVFSLMSLLSIWLKGKRRRIMLWVLFVLSMSTWSLAFFQSQGLGINHEVVLMESYNPKSGLSDNYPEVFSEALNPGSSGILLRSVNGWAQINWGKTSAWVPEGYIEIVQ
ncbi:MAG: hypothetical protein HQL32_08175 [Planctomycetes bacterium]|nr:hypothetical protein [Planctomycetota bacterium]